MGRRSANAGVRIRQALAECRHSRRADFGQGSAYAVIQALVLTAMIAVYIRLVRDEPE